MSILQIGHFSSGCLDGYGLNFENLFATIEGSHEGYFSDGATSGKYIYYAFDSKENIMNPKNETGNHSIGKFKITDITFKASSFV